MSSSSAPRSPRSPRWFFSSVLLAAVSCGRRTAAPPAEAPPDARAEASPPDAAPPPAARGPLRPPGGLVVARGWRRPRIVTGTSGAIVVFGQGSAVAPPPYAARSECEWREAAVVLPWSAFDGPEPAPVVGHCDPGRPAFRAALVHDAWEPAVVECASDRGFRCRVRSLEAGALADVAAPASWGLPVLAEFEGLPYQHVSGALLGPRSLAWVSTGREGKPIATSIAAKLPFTCSPESCLMTLWPKGAGAGLEVQIVHRSGQRVDIVVDKDGRAGTPAVARVEEREPLARGAHAIDGERRLVRRYRLATRDVDSPVDGAGAPVLDFQLTVGSEGPFMAWVEGDRPQARLRLAPMNMVATELAGTPVDLAGPGGVAEVSIDSLSGHTAIAWSERDGDVWIVRAAELVSQASLR